METFNARTVWALLLSTCIVIQVMTQDVFVIQAFLPLTGPNASRSTHLRRAMEMAISSSSHEGRYCLSVINTDDNPSHIVQQALIAAKTQSLIAFVSAEWDSWLVQQLQDLSHHFSIPHLLLYPKRDASPTSFSIIPTSRYLTKLLQELLGKFEWRDLVLVYPNDVKGKAVGKDVISFFDMDRKSTMELDQEAENFVQEGLVLDQMTADTIVVVNTQHNVTRKLFRDALWRRATMRNHSAIVLNGEPTSPEYLPPGTLVVQHVVSLPSKQAEFSHIFPSTSTPRPYPTGRNVKVTSEMIVAYDAVSFVIQAADIAASTVIGATRASIASSMSGSRHAGFSGTITFSKEGHRETSSALVFVAVTASNDDNLDPKINSSSSIHLELAFTFDGTRLLKAGRINQERDVRFAPLVLLSKAVPINHHVTDRLQGPSSFASLAMEPSSVPLDEPSTTPHVEPPAHNLSSRGNLTLRVPIIYSFSGNSSAIAPEFSLEVASYAAFRLNDPTRPHDEPGTLPTGASIDQSPLFDDGDIPVAAVRAAINISLFNTSEPPVLGVVGAYTSTMSAAIQTVFSSFGIAQLSPASTSPTLSNKSLYPTFARTCSSDINIAYTIVSLASQWQWNRVHMVSSSDDFSSGLSRSIVSVAPAFGVGIGIHVIVEPQLPSYVPQLQPLANIQPRILLLMVGSDSLMSMISSLFQSNIHPVAVLAPNTVTNLDMNFYARHANVSISYFAGWVTISDPIGFGPRYADFLDEINSLDKAVWPRVAEAIRIVPRLASVVECYMVWADVIRRGSASGLDFTSLAEVYQELLKTNMVSLSGNLSFLPNGDRPPTYEVWNVQNNKQVHLGRWEENTTLADLGAVIWPDGTTSVPVAVPREWLGFGSSAGIAFMVLSLVGIALCLIIMGILIWQRNSPVVLAATWPFLIVMLIGAIVGFASVFCWLGKPSKIVCCLRVWLPSIAFILILSPLLAKTWRIVRIFRTNNLEIKPIPLSQLIVIVSTLLGIQILINILWVSLGTLQPILVLDWSGAHTLVLCPLNLYNHIFLYITIGYVGLLLISAIYLAFRVRKVPKTYNESIWMARSIYNIALFAGLILILGYTLAQFQIVVLILICVITVVVAYTTMILLLGPKLWRLWKNPKGGGQPSHQIATIQSAPTTHCNSLQSGPTTHRSSLHSNQPQASATPPSPPRRPPPPPPPNKTSGYGKDDTMDSEMVTTKSTSNDVSKGTDLISYTPPVTDLTRSTP